jgi:chemotaxis protein MotB
MAAGKGGKDDAKRPIIIKKIKKGGHGHHGGAWKVAYADFVTAMMAFFLLLWLLSSSSKETLAGLSEYFTPTQGLKDSQGIGFEGGTSPTKDGTGKSNKSNPGVQFSVRTIGRRSDRCRICRPHERG